MRDTTPKLPPLPRPKPHLEDDPEEKKEPWPEIPEVPTGPSDPPDPPNARDLNLQ